MIEDKYGESCGVGPAAAKRMFHDLFKKRPSVAESDLNGSFQGDVAQLNDDNNRKDASSHQDYKSNCNQSKLYWGRIKTFDLLLLLVLLLSFQMVTDAQPSFFHQDNKFVDLFAESDLLFSNEMMRKAGCSYHYSSTTQLVAPQPISPALEQVQFISSGNVYLNLQTCEPKKLQIQHTIGSLDGSSEQHGYVCITSLWTCGAWVLMAVVSLIFDGGKTTGKCCFAYNSFELQIIFAGLSLFVVGFNMAKHDFNLQPYRNTILNNEESEVIEVFALYNQPTVNYPISVTDSCFNKPSCLVKARPKKGDSELTYANYKLFYVNKLESDPCFVQTDNSRILNSREALGYCNTKHDVTRIKDASRTANFLTVYSAEDQQVMTQITTYVLMALLAILVLTFLIIYTFATGSKVLQDGNCNNLTLCFENRDPIFYQPSVNMSQSKVDISVSQIIQRVVKRRRLHPEKTSGIDKFEIVRELSNEVS